MTEWEAPGPGPWQQDSAHMPVSTSMTMREIYPEGFNRGFTETFARYGMLLDRLAMAEVNGFIYHQPQPFDMPGPDGPMSPDEIGAEIGRRAAIAEDAFANKLWRQDLQLWDDVCKPEAIARHREFSDVELESLSDAELADHLTEVIAHVSAMAYQHHRFNVAAMLPVGDLAVQTAGWTGGPPTAVFGVLDGYSPISGVAPPEMTDALDAIRADEEARRLLDAPGDAGARLDQLRSALPAVDDYVRSVDARMIDGFDIVWPTLREQPEMILGKLAAAIDANTGLARLRADEAVVELRAQVPAEHRDAFNELVEEARLVYRLRDERGIYSDITAMGLLRFAMLEVGRRAAERGYIPQAELMVDALPDEAIATLSGNGPSAAELSARGEKRRALTAEGPPRFLGPPPPSPPPVDGLPPSLARVMSSVGFMIEGVLGEMDEAAGDSTVVVGIPGNDGVCEGVARRIDQIDDLLDLEDGEIVVAPSTGEAFNSILHLVGGIVTDHGSFICHAAIVAREMGFPAVVGTVDATSRISTGDRIRVDGTKGEVTIL
jgi:phosphohistidine swiveling domain-containing protein